MHTQIPDGYKKVFNFSCVRVMGSVVTWDEFIGEGLIFWHHFAIKKSFRIPFVVEQVEVPSFQTHDLFTLIHKGLGIEFVPLIKQKLHIHQLPSELKNNELLPFHLKIIIPKIQGVTHTFIQVQRPKGFLLRREDLVHE